MAVYFIQDEQGRIKIGYSTNPKSRVANFQTSSAEDLTLLGTVDGTLKTEKGFHKKYKTYRARGEWFAPDLKMAKELGNLLGVNVRTFANPESSDIQYEVVVKKETIVKREVEKHEVVLEVEKVKKVKTLGGFDFHWQYLFLFLILLAVKSLFVYFDVVDSGNDWLLTHRYYVLIAFFIIMLLGLVGVVHFGARLRMQLKMNAHYKELGVLE